MRGRGKRHAPVGERGIDSQQRETGETRTELTIITGSLWQPACQALEAVPSKIPLVFRDEAHYRTTFEPLLMEEARGAVRAEYDEVAHSGRGWPVTVTRCAPTKDGVFHLSLRPGDRGHEIALREGAIVVLCRRDLMGGRQQQQAGRWGPASGGGGGGPSPGDPMPMVTGLVRMRCRDAGQNLEVSVRPWCGHPQHQQQEQQQGGSEGGPAEVPAKTGAMNAPCMQALSLILAAGITTEGEGGGAAHGGGTSSGPLWLWLVPLSSLVTNVRELRVLGRLGDVALLPELLHPGGGPEAAREGQQEGAITQQELPQVWPQDARHDPFYRYLQQRYDIPQREAIVAAASHLARPEDLQAAAALGVPGAGLGGADGEGRGTTPVPGGGPLPRVSPITLVQGPPGTGKTHTVKGMLNTWHSIMYHRHHSAWLARAKEILTRSARTASGALLPGADLSVSLALHGGGASLLADVATSLAEAPKPRILVCAPSNAATDELLDRILTEGFCDFGGGTYRPNVVRVGAEEAPLSAAVKAVWTEAMINRYEAMNQETWALAYKDCDEKIANCDLFMGHMAAKLATVANAGEGGQDGPGSLDLDRMAANLVELHEHRQRAQAERDRLDRAAELAFKGANGLPGFVVRRIREDLEASFMEQAEMVFTTLSSTGRAVFGRLERGFDTVLIDEAAQASEIAALQPLLFGCRRLVLVGDPQQLPATLFSAAAKETLLERSLFERLAQAGTPVKMLNVQYRMHPEIRTFPSAYFYQGRLADGESVLREADQPPPYYYTDLLKPYVVYDVAGGREQLQGRSRSNEAEAQMALGLYMELLAAVRGPGVGAAAAAAAAAANGGAPFAYRDSTPQPQDGIPGRTPSTDRGFGPGGAAGGLVEAGGGLGPGGVPYFVAGGYTLKEGVTVGIISPYRAQRDLLRQRFVEALGPGVLDAVRIETVDSFQGKQLDVIILSCVRTARPGAPPPPPSGGGGGGGGVGFLADVRRMNVAITRAKRALWVLGQFAALRREPSWAALLGDAEARGCVIGDASAEELFDEYVEWKERCKAAAVAAAAAAAEQQQQQQQQQQRGGRMAGGGGGRGFARASTPPAVSGVAPGGVGGAGQGAGVGGGDPRLQQAAGGRLGLAADPRLQMQGPAQQQAAPGPLGGASMAPPTADPRLQQQAGQAAAMVSDPRVQAQQAQGQQGQGPPPPQLLQPPGAPFMGGELRPLPLPPQGPTQDAGPDTVGGMQQQQQQQPMHLQSGGMPRRQTPPGAPGPYPPPQQGFTAGGGPGGGSAGPPMQGVQQPMQHVQGQGVGMGMPVGMGMGMPMATGQGPEGAGAGMGGGPGLGAGPGAGRGPHRHRHGVLHSLKRQHLAKPGPGPGGGGGGGGHGGGGRGGGGHGGGGRGGGGHGGGGRGGGGGAGGKGRGLQGMLPKKGKGPAPGVFPGPPGGGLQDMPQPTLAQQAILQRQQQQQQ